GEGEALDPPGPADQREAQAWPRGRNVRDRGHRSADCPVRSRPGDADIAARGRPVTASTVNRELAILRHMLRLAEEWGYIAKVPKIRLSKEPEGRLRFLSEDEIERLLVGCE